MINESKKENCVAEILIIISALSISDPRERPLDKAEQADKAHLVFHDPDSGFNIFLKLFLSLILIKMETNFILL